MAIATSKASRPRFNNFTKANPGIPEKVLPLPGRRSSKYDYIPSRYLPKKIDKQDTHQDLTIDKPISPVRETDYEVKNKSNQVSTVQNKIASSATQQIDEAGDDAINIDESAVDDKTTAAIHETGAANDDEVDLDESVDDNKTTASTPETGAASDDETDEEGSPVNDKTTIQKIDELSNDEVDVDVQDTTDDSKITSKELNDSEYDGDDETDSESTAQDKTTAATGDFYSRFYNPSIRKDLEKKHNLRRKDYRICPYCWCEIAP